MRTAFALAAVLAIAAPAKAGAEMKYLLTIQMPHTAGPAMPYHQVWPTMDECKARGLEQAKRGGALDWNCEELKK